MSFTVQTIVDRAALLANVTIGSSGNISDSEALMLANMSIRQTVRETGAHNATDDLTLVDGTREYALPATYRNMIQVLWRTDSTTEFEVIPETDERENQLTLQDEGSIPEYWYERQKSDSTQSHVIGIIPTPNYLMASGTIRLEYNSVPADNTGLSDTCNYPDFYRDPIAYKLAMFFCQVDGDMATAGVYKSMFDDEMRRIAPDILRRRGEIYLNPDILRNSPGRFNFPYPV